MMDSMLEVAQEISLPVWLAEILTKKWPIVSDVEA